ncbi:3 5-cyclic nucleotide phosphodiesterase domain-containing protein [Cyclospora cayetanensis]|nr:3 5-cyclic nucleotide phosphodiesterase domain-containing protein [Cyclospora cayetanensis]
MANADVATEEADRKAIGEDTSTDCWMIAKACIRCADIGHSAVNWEQHYKWSRALMKEFFSQGAQELELGLPISPVCNEQTTDVPKSQIGFIRLICQPLFETLEQADASGAILGVCLTQMRSNSGFWQRISDTGVNWRDSNEVTALIPNASGTPPARAAP